MADDRIAEAQSRLNAARTHRPGSSPRRSAPQSLQDALRRVETGQVVPWASDEEIGRYEAARARRERADRIEQLGLGQLLADDALTALADDALASTEALDRVRRWVAYQAGPRARGSRPIVLLLGPPGIGKTVAAAWLLLSEGGRYVHASELAVLHGARWGAERARYEQLLAARVLVVDELGTEGDRHALAAIHDVVDRRQSAPRLTLLLGNLRRSELRQRYDARTIDRLRAVATVIELEGESMRRGQL